MNKELLQERKKMIYDFICDELYVPMKAKEMAIVLNVPKSQRGELLEVLDALTADGKVEISGRGKYVKSEGKYLTGVFTAHPRGFGFVTVEGEEEDIFIPAAQTNGALHKDTVQITLSKNSSGKRKEGTVTKILSRGTASLELQMRGRDAPVRSQVCPLHHRRFPQHLPGTHSVPEIRGSYTLPASTRV